METSEPQTWRPVVLLLREDRILQVQGPKVLPTASWDDKARAWCVLDYNVKLTLRPARRRSRRLNGRLRKKVNK